MPRFASWAFGEDAEFDGQSLFAETTPDAGRSARTGTLELTFQPTAIHRSSIVAHGVPGRDTDGFTITLGHAGAVSLSGTDRAGKPLRLSTGDGFVEPGERVQVTLSWSCGAGGHFSVVNCDRLNGDPGNPLHAFVTKVPLRATIFVSGAQALTFGASAGGSAPYFHGRISTVSLSDTVDAPTVTPPTARILRPSFGSRPKVMPRRIPARPEPLAPTWPRNETGQGLGRMIVSTADGPRLAESLRPGDEVLTRDNGLQPVRWVARTDLDWSALRDRPHLRPVVIRKGALGGGLPEADLALAPHHRLMMPLLDTIELPETSGPTEDRLVDARTLLGSRGVFEVEALGVSYVHLLFDRHEIIETNGLWTEAFHPGMTLRRACDSRRRTEILDIFPELNAETYPASR